MSNQKQSDDILSYTDNGLTEQVRHYDDTFSAWTAVKEYLQNKS